MKFTTYMIKTIFISLLILNLVKFAKLATLNLNRVGTKTKSELVCDKYIDNFRDRRRPAISWIHPVTQKPLGSFKGHCKKVTNPLVTAGRIAQPGEFPHVVALGNKDKQKQFNYLCTGTLISERWVLTVAHCIRQPLIVDSVFLGSNRLTSRNGLFISVKNTVLHPKSEASSLRFDIALLEMMELVKFGQFVKPACLHTNDKVQTNVIVAGWGGSYLEDDNIDRLKKARLNVIDNLQCSQKYNVSDDLPRGIEDAMLCAGDVTGDWRSDTCTGDSGAPLQKLHASKCMHEIVGLASFGQFCAFQEMPAVYTRISSFVEWIESVVWPSTGDFKDN